MHWRSVGLTDRGRRRRRNEDALLVLPESRIYAVADGMGGHAAGDVASRLAVDALARAFARPPSPLIHPPALARRLIRAFEAANAAVLSHAAANPACSGMGTTLTALVPLLATPQCVIAHVGDTRAYRVRDGAATCMTRDHTWVQQQVDAGMLTSGAARHHQLSSVLSRVLGTEAVGPADTFVVDARPGDLFLLCSDGLTNMIEDAELAGLLAGTEHALDAAQRGAGPRDAAALEPRAARLIAVANERGGPDNITVLLLEAVAP